MSSIEIDTKNSWNIVFGVHCTVCTYKLFCQNISCEMNKNSNKTNDQTSVQLAFCTWAMMYPLASNKLLFTHNFCDLDDAQISTFCRCQRPELKTERPTTAWSKGHTCGQQPWLTHVNLIPISKDDEQDKNSNKTNDQTSVQLPAQLAFLQRVSIACYAERCISYRKSVRLSVCPSVCLSVRHTLALSQNDSSYDHGVFTGR